ncbi:MAG: TrmH family RNA methyltransferase [Saprospiraceae bacterium]
MEIRKLSLEDLNRDLPEVFKQKSKVSLFFVADHIRSGHNIGALFRIADAFSFSKIYICGYSFELNHPEVQKTALGATETITWEYYKDTLECILALKKEGVKIIGIEQTNQSIELQNFSISPNESYALILGNEVKGISNEILSTVDYFIEIPQHGTKHSLNVSVAAGIVAWEFIKKMKT